MSNDARSETGSPEPRLSCLMMAVGTRICALPLAYAGETMRPLRVDPIEGASPYVLGLSMVRGHPTPVVHLGHLLGARDLTTVSRFVTLRLGDRALALAVDSVLGVRDLERTGLEPLPAILGAEGQAAIESIGRLDGRLLVVLRAMSVVPEALWQTLRAESAAPS